jgi:hypothetical protein
MKKDKRTLPLRKNEKLFAVSFTGYLIMPAFSKEEAIAKANNWLQRIDFLWGFPFKSIAFHILNQPYTVGTFVLDDETKDVTEETLHKYANPR